MSRGCARSTSRDRSIRIGGNSFGYSMSCTNCICGVRWSGAPRADPTPHMTEVKTELYEVARPSAPVKKFDTKAAFREMKSVVDKKLERKTYETEEASKVSKELADEIRNKMRINLNARYKIFTVVSIYSQKGQGLRQCSRCYYDAETDDEVTYVFQNESLICVATVYAIYYY